MLTRKHSGRTGPSNWDARGQPLSQSEHPCDSAAALSGQRAEGDGKEGAGLFTKGRDKTGQRAAEALRSHSKSTLVEVDLILPHPFMLDLCSDSVKSLIMLTRRELTSLTRSVRMTHVRKENSSHYGTRTDTLWNLASFFVGHLSHPSLVLSSSPAKKKKSKNKMTHALNIKCILIWMPENILGWI